jgi:hemolysin activation/secretion protein
MKNRIITLILAVFLTFSLVACTSDTPQEESTRRDRETTTTTAPTQDAPEVTTTAPAEPEPEVSTEPEPDPEPAEPYNHVCSFDCDNHVTFVNRLEKITNVCVLVTELRIDSQGGHFGSMLSIFWVYLHYIA